MKQPLPLLRETLASPIGEVVILTDEEGRLRAVDFCDYTERMTRLLDRYYCRGGWMIADAPSLSAAKAALARYFAGDIAAIDDLETATNGTAFQRSVWAALRGVPASAPTSYGALADQLGKPKAMRATGLANGANPIAIVVPCHRVIGKDGSLTGYGGGLERKRWLLEHEAGAASGKTA